MTDASHHRRRTWTIRWDLWQVFWVGGLLWAVSGLPAAEPMESPTQSPKAKHPPWQKLFADEDWYKKADPQEMILRGTLEALPEPKGPDTLMRTYHYRLRQWNIYTGGKRMNVLDQRVGQEVELLGKEVKMSLEGREMVEFWPAAVRRALPRPKGPIPKIKPSDLIPKELTEPKPSPKEPAGPQEPKLPATQPDQAEWQKLFADQDWYQQAQGKEQIFHGQLEAVPQAGGIGFFMRASFYRLGNRTLYTGARKIEILEKLIGRQVEILGKPVDMALEGRQVQEIWPAAVRPTLSENPPAPPKESSKEPTPEAPTSGKVEIKR